MPLTPLSKRSPPWNQYRDGEKAQSRRACKGNKTDLMFGIVF